MIGPMADPDARYHPHLDGLLEARERAIEA
jgi:hypothetical protein